MTNKIMEPKEEKTYPQRGWEELVWSYFLSLLKKFRAPAIKQKALEKEIKITLKDEGDKRLLMDQYKILIEGLNKSNENREALNNFWTTLNGAILAAITYVKDMQVAIPNPKNLFIWALWGMGITVSVIWLISLANIKRNIDLKNELIVYIEQFLPAKIYTTIFTITGRRQGKHSVSAVEKIVPLLFCLGYISMGIILFIYPNIL